MTTPITGQETPPTTRETTPITGQETGAPTQERIVALLRAEPAMTQVALSEELGITAEGVKYHLKQLKAAGRIRREGPNRTGRWEVLR